jgi:hypothetical protein
MMNEDIDPLEATTFVGSVQTIVDGKRDVGYIALKNIPKDEIEQIKTLISDNNLKILSVKGDQKPTIIYKADKESEAKELKDIAEKYNGYLSIKATEEESRRIGEILGYSKESIDKYIEKLKVSNIKEIVTDTEVICDKCGWQWPIADGGDDLYICHKCGHDNNPDLDEASDPQAGTALPYGSGFAPVKENDPFGLNELARQFMGETLKEMWKPEESFVSLSKYMIDNGMNIKPLPKIKVISDDEDNASNLLGKTAYYNPTDKSITLYTMDRHPKDILRSFAHEMVHHEQNLDGRLNNINTTNTNSSEQLNKLEEEAYLKGNMTFRNWEDNIKNNKTVMNETRIPSGFVIYCDMDGVLCDFEDRFKEFTGMSCREYENKYGTKAFWDAIGKEGVEYWSKMPWMVDGKQLWDYIAKYNPIMLSATSWYPSSKICKYEWVKENLTPDTKVILVNKKDKQLYAGENKILIDDRTDNISDWKNAGGIGILHKTATQTINELKKLGL